MKITEVIVPAAGQGVRFAGAVPKPLVLLKGKPILVYSLEIFERCSLVEGIIVVAPEALRADFEKVIGSYRLKKVKAIVPGGKTRSESVSHGLKAVSPATEFVVVHDAARPLTTLKLVEEALTVCYRESAVIAAVPVKPTIKRVNPQDRTVEATLDRDLLWEVQTPQVFARDILVKAHEAGGGIEATDDAALVERLGVKVTVVMGDYRNIKVTTPEDLKIAEALLD